MFLNNIFLYLKALVIHCNKYSSFQEAECGASVVYLKKWTKNRGWYGRKLSAKLVEIKKKFVFCAALKKP